MNADSETSVPADMVRTSVPVCVNSDHRTGNTRGRWFLPWIPAVAVLIVSVFLFRVLDRRPDESTGIPEIPEGVVNPAVRETLTRLRDGVVRQPQSSGAWGVYGMSLLQHDRPAEAIDCFQAALRFGPDDARWHYLIGIAQEQSDLPAAIRSYESAVEHDSRYFPLRIRLAAALMTLGEFDRAQRHLTDCSGNDAVRAAAFLHLARLARIRGTPEEAEEWLNQARDADAVTGALLEEVARTRFQSGEQSAAARLLEESRSVTRDPKLNDPWYEELSVLDASGALASAQADRLRSTGRLSEAASTFSTLAQRFPERSRPLMNLALTLRDQGKIDAACIELEQLTIKFPDDPLILFHLAVTRAMLDDTGGAMAAIETCLALKPDYGLARAVYGDLLEATGRPEDGIRAAQEAAHYSPGDVWIRIGLISLLLRNGQFDAASQELTAAKQLIRAEQTEESEILQNLERQLTSSIDANRTDQPALTSPLAK